MKCPTSRFNINSELSNPLITRSKTTILKKKTIMIKDMRKSNTEFSEIIKSNTTKDGTTLSISSVILVIFILSISTCQLGIYRFVSNNIKLSALDESLFSELTIITWRFEAILLALTVYVALMNLINRFVNNSFVKMHNINSIYNIFKLSNLISGFTNFIYCFLLMTSTSYLTLGLCVVINNMGNFIQEKNAKHAFAIKFIMYTFLVCSLILFFDSYSITTTSIYYFICGMVLVLGSFCLNYFIQRPAMRENMKEQTIFELIIGLYFYSTIFSLLSISVGGLVLNGSIISFNLYGWIYHWNLSLIVIISFGILGLLYVLTSTITSIYLQSEVLNFLKFLEIPLNDIYGSMFFSLYEIPFTCISYCLATFMAILGLFVSDYGNILFYKKSK